MNTLVTGGAGFIGSHIAERLIGDGHRVFVVDDLSSGYEKNIPDGVDFIKTNILSIEAYRPILREVDVVFHNAASKKNVCLVDPEYDLEVNGKGALRLVAACRDAGVKKFIHASTGSVYGPADGKMKEDMHLNPASYYGVSKLAGERYVSLFGKMGMDVTILRYFHVYGNRQEDDPMLGGVVAVFRRQIKEGGPITIHGDGGQKRVFTHVDDIVEINMRAWHNAVSSGKTYNCASNIKISVIGLAGELINKCGEKMKIEYLPPLEGDIRYFDVDNSAVINDLGVTFTPFTP